MKKIVSIFALGALLAFGQLHAQSRNSTMPTVAAALAAPTTRVLTNTTEGSPFIRINPEAPVPPKASDCTSDYSVTIDMKKPIIPAGQDGEMTVTLKSDKILPQLLPTECIVAWARHRAFTEIYPLTNAANYPFTFKYIKCEAIGSLPKGSNASLAQGSCLPRPNPMGSIASGAPVGLQTPNGIVLVGNLYMNYVTERVYTVQIKRNPGNTKAWEFSKTAFTNSPTGTPNRFFKATIESNTSYVVDNNPKNDVDMIYFRESFPVPLKLSNKSTGAGYLSPRNIQIGLQSETSTFYQNVIADPNLSHEVEVRIQPTATNPFNYNSLSAAIYQNLHLVEANTYGKGSITGSKSIFLNVAAQKPSEDARIITLVINIDGLKDNYIGGDFKIIVLVSQSGSTKKIYEDTITFDSESYYVGAAVEQYTISSSDIKFNVVVKNFWSKSTGVIEGKLDLSECTSANGQVSYLSTLGNIGTLFPINPVTPNSSETYTVTIPNAIPWHVPKPIVSCSGFVHVSHTKLNSCTETSRSSNCRLSSGDIAVEGKNPDINGNTNPHDDGNKFIFK